MLKPYCKLIQRIESGETGRGIPDIYCRFTSDEQWLELKNDRFNSIYNGAYIIKWRPGQQAWHYEYHKATGNKKSVLTISAMKDGFVVIPLKKRYIHNIVPFKDCVVCTELKDILGIILSFI
jgi:hypothetical protein